MNPSEIKSRLEARLRDVPDQYRGIILDSVEQEIGDTEAWIFMRSRLFKALGDRGLSGRIQDAINFEFARLGSPGGN